jgi:hypothetical protein
MNTKFIFVHQRSTSFRSLHFVFLATLFFVMAFMHAQSHAQSGACPGSTDYYGIQLYDPRCSSTVDRWGQSGVDHRLHINSWGTPIEVTSAWTLGGAIASVKVGGFEYIASGGHGAAFQWALHHPSSAYGALDECNNPTQAGTIGDGLLYPTRQYHGPSRSAVLFRPQNTNTQSITQSRLAVWLQQGEVSGYDSPPPSPPGYRCTASYTAGSTERIYGLSDTWLTQTVQLAPGPRFADRPNVFSVRGQIGTSDSAKAFDGFLIAYLRREFKQLYSYNPASKVLIPYQPTNLAYPIVACTQSGYCMGLYFTPTNYQTGPSSPANENLVYYGYKLEPGAGSLNEVTFIQVTIKQTTLSNTRPKDYTIYAVVGNKAMVQDSLCIMRERDRLNTDKVFACVR